MGLRVYRVQDIASKWGVEPPIHPSQQSLHGKGREGKGREGFSTVAFQGLGRNNRHAEYWATGDSRPGSRPAT